MNKPEFLYHGSSTHDIEELEPRQESYRDRNDGPLIFATPNLAIATVFMATGASIELGHFNDIPYAVFQIGIEEFIKNDKGGVVYVLPSDEFTNNPNIGMGRSEWTTNTRIKPLRIIKYTSVLDAMIENGVQVYFVDDETMSKIKSSQDHGFSILSSLKSVNQLKGKNVKSLA